MIRSPKAILLLLAAAIAITGCLSASLFAQAQTPKDQRAFQASDPREILLAHQMAESPTLFDLDFRGGTLGDYADAIRDANPGANIVLLGDVARQPVPAIRLRSVNVHAALSVIQHETMDRDEFIRVHVRSIPVPGAGDGVFQVNVERQHNARSAARRDVSSMVWNLSEILQHGMDAESVLGAIQAGLDLSDDDSVRIRYHEPTRLLVAFGTQQQLNFIQQVISALELQIEV